MHNLFSATVDPGLSEFSQVQAAHRRLNRVVAAGGDPSAGELREFIRMTVNLSSRVEVLEDREQMRYVLRVWASYLSHMGEAVPDTDIDTPERSPARLRARTGRGDAPSVARPVTVTVLNVPRSRTRSDQVGERAGSLRRPRRRSF